MRDKKENREETIRISVWRKLWRIAKPLVTYDLCLIGASLLGALLIMQFSPAGDLMEKQYRISTVTTTAAALVGIVLLWKQYRADDDMFPEARGEWKPARIAAGVLLVMTFGHLFNVMLEQSGFLELFSSYSDLAAEMYEGQNPFLLILSVGILSAAAEEIAFRGLIYRRAKDFWGAGWGMAVSALLFGLYHGNMVQFVYGTVVSIWLVFLYEKSGNLLVPVLAHMGENIWGLFRKGLMEQLDGRVHYGSRLLLAAEAVLFVGTILYLFGLENRKKPGETRKKL